MYGIAGMPIADANALMFTMPLFTVILAAIWLAERPGIHRISATIFGFAGALIILRPGMIEISMAALATLFAAAMFSGALIGSKMLTATENPNAMVFYLYTLMIPPAAIGALFGWTNPGLSDIPLLIALGACTVGAQQCQTRAFWGGAGQSCRDRQLRAATADRAFRLADLCPVDGSLDLGGRGGNLHQHLLCQLS